MAINEKEKELLRNLLFAISLLSAEKREFLAGYAEGVIASHNNVIQSRSA